MMRDVLSWSLPIGQMFGIMVRVHFTMPMMMIGLIGREYLRHDTMPNAWHDAAMVMGLMFLSVLLHEFGHCFAARFMDGEADEVLLWPIGGLATCKSLPFTWRAHFVFTLGGPLVNLVLCVICALLLAFALDQPYSVPFNPIWYPYRWNESGAMSLAVWGSADVLSSNLLAIILVALLLGELDSVSVQHDDDRHPVRRRSASASGPVASAWPLSGDVCRDLCRLPRHGGHRHRLRSGSGSRCWRI